MSKNKRVRLYSKKSWDKVNKDNKFLLEDYMMELEAKGIRESTRKQYYSDIRGFYCFLHDNHDNIYILDADRRLFRNFYIKYQRSNTSSSRINRHQSSIRSLLEYAYENEEEFEYDRNVMGTIKGLENIPVSESIWLSEEEMTFLIKHCIEEGNLQKALYISLSYDSAARRNEIYQVTKDSFDNEERRVTNEVEGKRGKMFPLVYSTRTVKIAKEYFKERGEDDIESLWVTSDAAGNKSRVSYNTLYYWITTLKEPLQEFNDGEYKDFSPHDFRRSSLENLETGTHYMLKDLGVERLDIDMVQQIARHQSSETTKNFYLIDKSEENFNNLFGL